MSMKIWSVARRSLAWGTAGVLLAASVPTIATASDSQTVAPPRTVRFMEPALFLTADSDRGREVYEICTPCHKRNGWGERNGSIPQIAGQHPLVIIKQLLDIRVGNRRAPEMYPFTLASELGGSQAIADVAAYIARLPMSPYNGVGAGADLETAAELYDQSCAHCHGASGEGNAEADIPRIQGQHYAYLVRQFALIRGGDRRKGGAEMTKQIRDLPEEDVPLILDYVSRMQPARTHVARECWRILDQPPPRAEPHRPCWSNPDFLW